MRKNLYDARKKFYDGLALLDSKKSFDKGVRLLEKANKFGSPLALYQLGLINRRADLPFYVENLEYSDHVLSKAKVLLEENSTQGLDAPMALHYLASYYFNGYAGTEVNKVKGENLEILASEAGLIQATEYLLNLYADEEGSFFDPSKVLFYKELLEDQKTNEDRVKTPLIESAIAEEVHYAVERSCEMELLGTLQKPLFNENLSHDVIYDKSNISVQEDLVLEEEFRLDEEHVILSEKMEESNSIFNNHEIVNNEDYFNEPIIDEIKPLSTKGVEPSFDMSRFIPKKELPQVEIRTFSTKSTKIKIEDARMGYLPGDEHIYYSPSLFLPRTRPVYLDPVYSEDELTPEHLADQDILKALRLLETREESSIPEALALLNSASKCKPILVSNLLGDLYYEGDLLKQDLIAAMHFYKRAADMRSIYASYMVGLIYLEADDKDIKDPALGARFIKRAAVAGYPKALRRLGSIYKDGELTTVNYQAAYGFYQLAIDRGDLDSYRYQAMIDEIRGDYQAAAVHLEKTSVV